MSLAGDYPESVAENMGKVLKFPQVRVPGEEVPYSGEEVDMEFEVFVTMFSFGDQGDRNFYTLYFLLRNE